MSHTGNHELLGRLVPPDFEHVEKYNVRTIAAPQVTNGVFGINWYESFFTPKKDAYGRYVIGATRRWGKVAGGHAIRALKKDYAEPRRISITFDQRQTPRCVGYSTSAELTDMTGVLVDPDQTYHDAQSLDSIPGPPPPYDGTEVRAAFEAFRTLGPALEGKGKGRGKVISAYYWCTTVEEVWKTLGYDDSDDMIALHQTWHSSGYPDLIWIPRAAVARLLKEDGEFGFMQL